MRTNTHTSSAKAEERADERAREKGWRFGCLSLFALPFAAIGLLMLGWIIVDAVSWLSVQSWQPVNAVLLDSKLSVNSGDGSSTYEATARYRYEYNGVAYEGDRVGIGNGADNIGSFHQQVHAQLKAKLQSGEPIKVWVNPSSPENALLNRTYRWELVGFRMIFAVIFGGLGFGSIFADRYGRRAVGRSNALRESYPDAPWMWRADWVKGEVLCNSKGMMLVVLAFAVLWNAISLPVLFVVPDALEKQEYGVLVALIFPLVGVVLAAWAWQLWRRYRRFGRSKLCLASIPFQPGGMIDAKLQLPADVYDAQQLSLTLNCMERRTTGSGDDKRTRVTPVWQRDFTVSRGALLAAGVDGLPVKLLLPEGAAETSAIEGGDGIFWQLVAKAGLSGVDYNASFELPVFASGESAGEYLDDGMLRADKPQFNQAGLLLPDQLTEQQLSEQGITMTHDRHGWSVHFSRLRNRGAAFSLLFFTTVWIAISASLWVFKVPIFLPLVFSFFGVIMLLSTLELLLGRSVVRAHRGELLFQRGWFRLRDTVIPIEDIESITAERGMQMGSRLYYRARLQRHHGKTLTLASGLRGIHVAEQLVAEIDERVR